MSPLQAEKKLSMPLKLLNNNKSPSIDELPAELLKTLPEAIDEILMSSLTFLRISGSVNTFLKSGGPL